MQTNTVCVDIQIAAHWFSFYIYIVLQLQNIFKICSSVKSVHEYIYMVGNSIIFCKNNDGALFCPTEYSVEDNTYV